MVGKVTRRQFLGSSAAAAVVAGTMAKSTVFGANDRIVIASFGVGNMGSGHARRFNGMDGADVAVIADVDRNAAEAVAADVDAEVYEDYRAVLDRDDIDAVIVATPLQWHALNTIHAAQAGKDIYCEKCASLTIPEGRLMAEAVKKYERVFQTGSQQRSGQREYEACMHVRNGSIGKVTRVLAQNYHSPMEFAQPAEPIPEYLNWDTWCGPVELYPFNMSVFDNGQNPSWVSLRPFSGGDMTDWGSHGLDMAQWGLGMDDSGPIEIWTEGEPFERFYSTAENPGGRHQGPRAPKVLMRYAGDIVMEFEGGPGNSGVRFIGEEGSITMARNQFDADPSELTEALPEDPEVEVYHSTNHYQNWLDCIRDRTDPVAHVEVGHRSASVCHLANIARWVSEINQETGERLAWDPVEERFTNSEVANNFLDYPRRAGYELPDTV
ncbi:MAG: Gfo/Idh/MocA family oxidoreductase [Candidatus Hydrogenedentota bacterium]